MYLIYLKMEVKERILTRAEELIPLIGIKGLTMDYMANDLGISKRTIYELFRDKDDMILQAMEYLVTKNNRRLLEIVENSDDMMEAIFNIIEEQYRKMSSLNPLIAAELKLYFTRFFAQHGRNCEKFREYSVIYALLEKGIKQGIFRPETNIEVVDNFLHDLIDLMHNMEGKRSAGISRKDALEQIFLPYFRGISTPKGQAQMDTYISKMKF